MKLTHIDETGRARMVDISSKRTAARTARAQGCLFIQKRTAELIRATGLPKGNPFEVARIAGVQAAKKTAALIPLCHSINLDFVDVKIDLWEDRFVVESTVRCRWATGVEMEALTAVTVAALTLYDMCKAVDSEMSVGEVRLLEKRKDSQPDEEDQSDPASSDGNE